MAFNINEVGKIVVLPNKNERDFPTFGFVVGYNYVTGQYIASDMSDICPMLSMVDEVVKRMTVEEAIEYVVGLIQETEKLRQNLFSDYNYYQTICQAKNRVNYKNELLHLSNAYHGALIQRKWVEYYSEHARSEKMRNQYAHELTMCERGLRKTEKRFHFFFGDRAERIMSCIAAVGPTNSIRRRILQYDDTLKRLNKLIEKIQNKSVQFQPNSET